MKSGHSCTRCGITRYIPEENTMYYSLPRGWKRIEGKEYCKQCSKVQETLRNIVYAY